MCGRFSLTSSGAALAEQFELAELPALEPRYNIAPSQPVAVVRNAGEARELALLRWGLVPAWAKDVAIGTKMINARAETVGEKPSFRSAFKQRRCLVLADGFYEWQVAGDKRPKQPFYIQMQDHKPFAFAGLWERHTGAGGADGALETCTIITTTPNDLMQPIHNRMPVILRPADYALWLDPTAQDPEPLQALLQPYPATLMQAVPVSRTVNNARHDSPACIAPLNP